MHGEHLSIGDGWCDEDNNNADCRYDGGDCCYCSCANDADSICSASNFDCRDPDNAGDEISDCIGELSVDAPCSTNASIQRMVNDTASATALADAIRCSGGAFNVQWFGHVVVSQTIKVMNGTVLHVSGVGPGAEMQAASGTRLIVVSNASLNIRNIGPVDGMATFGGAIAAAGAHLSFENTSFTGNGAHLAGGALYATLGSVASFGDGILFDRGHSGGKGGALSFEGASSVMFHGNTSFTNNNADGSGGALSVSSSDMLWAGDTLFSNNTASYLGGALYAYFSSVSWAGDAIFSENTAAWAGGALDVDGSYVSWAGNALFSGNTASWTGGALAVKSSIFLWTDDVSFSGNTANERGGALYVVSSGISRAGNAFFNNIAGSAGGALFVDDSTVAWAGGDVTFSDNTADEWGGAVYAVSSNISWGWDVMFSENNAGFIAGALGVESSRVSWAGDAIFANNTAHERGGALSVLGSNLFWASDAVFSKNTVVKWGGALMASSSNVSWAGNTLCTDNTAHEWGGALVFVGSHVVFAGYALFSNNIAHQLGGALFLSNSKTSFWGGSGALSLFFNNAADSDGGALYAWYSHVSWAGNSSFSDNTANGRGGSILLWTSHLSWTGSAVFTENSCGHLGGALQAWKSSASWMGNAVFSNNTADTAGGVLHAWNSSVSWRGQVCFVGNAATGYGGALYLGGRTRASLELDALFVLNRASVDGGAIFVYSNEEGTNFSSLHVKSTTTFLENHCGSDGGALALVASALATPVMFATGDVTFSHNSAHVAGGAVVVKGLGVGPQFKGFTFVSNQAQIGGAVYVTSSGTTITEDPSGIQIENPTVFDRCKFIGNEAWATGGAIDTGAGLDMIANTYFLGNAARAGGALKLAGIATLHNCTFRDNTSDDDEGPAVFNGKSISSVTTCSFADNTFNCGPGEFLDYQESNTLADTFAVVCGECNVECHQCTASRRVPVCAEELKHTKSTGGNATIEALEIDCGYWRATNTSRKVLACYNPDACSGGVTGARNYCSAGYEGPYCSTCREGYSPGLGRTCSKCSESIGSIVATIIITISAFVVVVLLLSYLICRKSTGSGRALLSSWSRRLLSLKIIIIVWQLVTQFASVANVTYPVVYQRVLEGVDIFNFDINLLLSTECVIDLDFHGRLIVSTVGPPAALTILGVIYLMHAWWNRPPYYDFMVAAQDEVRQKFFSVALLVIFLVYSSVSSTLFQMFTCDELDDGKSYLRADYRIDCNSSTHRSLQVYAACMMLVYTVGMPVMSGTLLFRNRQLLMDESRRQDDVVAKSISSLWKLYECARRILLAGVVVFIFPNTAAQVAVALMIATFFMVLSEMLAPYESWWDVWINRIGHAIVFGSIYLVLLLMIDVSSEREGSQRIFEGTLIAGHACMLLLVMLEGIVVTYQWMKRSV